MQLRIKEGQRKGNARHVSLETGTFSRKLRPKKRDYSGAKDELEVMRGQVVSTEMQSKQLNSGTGLRHQSHLLSRDSWRTRVNVTVRKTIANRKHGQVVSEGLE